MHGNNLGIPLTIPFLILLTKSGPDSPPPILLSVITRSNFLVFPSHRKARDSSADEVSTTSHPNDVKYLVMSLRITRESSMTRTRSEKCVGTCALGSSPGHFRGRIKVNMLPSPSPGLETSILASIVWHTFLTFARPIPVPELISDACSLLKNISNTRETSASLRPIPLSAT